MRSEPQIGIEPMTASFSQGERMAESVAVSESSGSDGDGQGAENTPNPARNPSLKRPDCKHDVRAWSYAMQSVHPRAYGHCWKCDRMVVVILPRKLNEFDDWTANRFEQGATERPADFAQGCIESFLRDRLNCHNPHAFFGTESATVSTEFMHAIELELRRELNDEARPVREAMENVARDVERLTAEVWHLEDRYRKLGKKLAKRERSRGRDVIAMTGDGVAVVYALVSSEFPDVHRYIGSTDSPRARFLSHTSDKAAPKVREWVCAVRDAGYQVQMLRLWEGFGRAETFAVERRMIAESVAAGGCDLNTSRPRTTPASAWGCAS